MDIRVYLLRSNDLGWPFIHTKDCPPSPGSICSMYSRASTLPAEDEPLDNTVVLDQEAGQQYVWNQRTVYTRLLFVLIETSSIMGVCSQTSQLVVDTGQ